ncbi:transketolase [Candidatus Shapirobacteria bacterium CG08_land_8_20_14_0_20_39_18]|uniref:Transketolase n=1 Tax=Candidatus Shapirobacteria bacterium CG08_land_8_20_14_0_20_39_18 TaxID=1974883 RepID=A0A2M6XBZ8_9BACT|nr:MAG: transketolase [Candidatus Shapirobacteria bacterium CG08_land_8_20_14_0_20_39_18]PIY65380.1 MAG: transketolase [Candidatus Shapirobacteria bacterium CG_4_10_14_0_8_um_filter_39_15]PJE68589.1 MAG: transketolase [Candidatus Shapirobacteria bacterium CG10_big_fil_rev_8_21_14_0_10_38_8]
MIGSQTKTMRDVFLEQIYRIMKRNKKIFFLSADFGAPTLDSIRKDYPDRFINVGIAEQNLINVSTGLALEGFTVYAYGIASFLTMRAFEQIRINLAMLSQIRQVNVNLIGVGGGMSYVVSGPTHHCLEDLSIIRTLPNILLFSPSDWVLAEQFANYTINNKGPKYIRFEGKPVVQIYDEKQKIDFTKGFNQLFRGEKICIVSNGYMTHRALEVRDTLASENIKVGVIDVFLLKPLNEKLLYERLKQYKYIITIEEAFLGKGGLDSLISDILTKNKSSIVLNKMGIGDSYTFNIGNREYLHKINNLDGIFIAKKIKKLLSKI